MQRRYLEQQRRFLAEPVRPVIVVPGFGVSKLYDAANDEFVWGPPKTMMRPRLDARLELSSDGSTPLSASGFLGSRGPINSAYRISSALQKFGPWTSESKTAAPTIYSFAYDFRLSFGDNAAALGRYIDHLRNERDEPDAKFDLVGHSAGALLIATYLAIGDAGLENDVRWPEGSARARSRVANAVLLAAPLRGTPEAFRFLLSGDRIVRRSFSPSIVATFPSVFEMLPAGPFAVDPMGVTIDLDSAARWKERRLAIWRNATPDPSREHRFAELLERRAMLQRALATLETDGRIHAIAGDCVPTIERIVVRHDGTASFYPSQLQRDEEHLARFVPGDGSVTAKSATAIDSTPALICIGHQGLVSDPDAIRAMLRALLPSASLPPARAQ